MLRLNLASMKTPTCLGALLLGLSAMLLAADIGGTVLLDNPRPGPADVWPDNAVAPVANVARSSPLAATAPVIAASSAIPVAPAAAVAPTVHVARITPVARPRGVSTVRTIAPSMVRAVRVARATSAAHVPVAVRVAKRPAVTQPAAATHRVVVAFVPVAPARPVYHVPAQVQVATLRDVRHYVMRRLKATNRNISVISSETYAIAPGRVEVAMVVSDRRHRWFEKDIVRRNGLGLAMVGTGLHAMPDYVTANASRVSPGP